MTFICQRFDSWKEMGEFDEEIKKILNECYKEDEQEKKSIQEDESN